MSKFKNSPLHIREENTMSLVQKVASKLFFVTLFASLVTPSMNGFAANGKIAGRVFDKGNKQPLAGANVFVESIWQLGKEVNYHRQRRWLDILALKGVLLGLVIILYFGAFANRFIIFCTTEVMYLNRMITSYAQNSISKIRYGAPKILSIFF